MTLFCRFLFTYAFLAIYVPTASKAIHLRPRIAKGMATKDDQFPYMASLFDNRFASHFCGGAIISDQYILSAASCLFYYKLYPEFISVSLGSNFFMGNILRNISKVITYEHSDKFKNDLAMLRVSESISFTKYIQPIQLPNKNIDRTTKRRAAMCGFGNLSVSIVVDI